MTRLSLLSRRRAIQGLATSGAVLAAGMTPAASATTALLKVGTVKYGSVNWLVETMRAEGIDRRNGLELAPVELSNNHAGPVSLLSGGSDVIVSDWTWALRQRGLGEPLKFAPYSSSLGSLVVPGDSPIKTLADLKGRRLGVAGSSIDKSWLLLQAYARQTAKIDLASTATVVYGAPPLLAEQARDGKLDATLNFWTQTVRLKTLGFREILTMAEVFRQLGVGSAPAFVGFVWKEATATQKGAQISALLAAAAETNALLATSDPAWERIRPLMKAQSDAEFEGLKSAYRAGIVQPWTAADTAAASKIMKLLVENGDTELVGAGTRFDPELFHAAKA